MSANSLAWIIYDALEGLERDGIERAVPKVGLGDVVWIPVTDDGVRYVLRVECVVP